MDRFTLKAKPEPNDPAGQSSVFTAKSVHLAKAFAGKAGRSAELQLVLDGKQLVGKIEQSHDDHDQDHGHGHDHDHDHGHDHGSPNVLLWHEEFAFEGYALRLGQHGLVVESGTELEPAVSIERDGQAVSDAKISVSLLDADGEKTLAKAEQAIFEPATEEEPAHYAQDFLFVPKNAKKVTIRYQIDFADGSTTTRDILIQTESHAH